MESFAGSKSAAKLRAFEGLVAKRVDSIYPTRLRSPEIELPFWMKHRWAFWWHRLLLPKWFTDHVTYEAV
jgi:hypothetical protein